MCRSSGPGLYPDISKLKKKLGDRQREMLEPKSLVSTMRAKTFCPSHSCKWQSSGPGLCSRTSSNLKKMTERDGCGYDKLLCVVRGKKPVRVCV